MIYTKTLRKLARSHKWLVLYARSKDIGSLKLFRNEGQYFELQVVFLHWLETYYNLYLDKASQEPYMDENTIENDIRCDAYLYYKYNVKQKEENKEKNKGSLNLNKAIKSKKGKVSLKEMISKGRNK